MESPKAPSISIPKLQKELPPSVLREFIQSFFLKLCSFHLPTQSSGDLRQHKRITDVSLATVLKSPENHSSFFSHYLYRLQIFYQRHWNLVVAKLNPA
jgi:hypothetical protein